MLTTIAKRIQSRLSRTGLKVSLADIKTRCELMIADIDNPTEVELLAVQEYFMSNASQLTVINNDVETIEVGQTPVEEQPEPICNLINAIALQMNISLSSEDRVAIEGKLSSQSPGDIKDAIVGYLRQKNQLATTTKNELVSQAASSLNIELSTTEIENIATNFNSSSDDFTSTLEELKSAILAFIAHKVNVNNQIIANTINQIYDTATAGFESNNQHLNNGLNQLNQALNQQSSDFKSRLKSTLEKFKLPAA